MICLGFTRSDRDIVQNIGFCIFILVSVISTSFLLLGWYYTMPNFVRYGALLDVNPLLIRHPNLIKNVCHKQNFIFTVVFLASTFVVPMVEPSLQSSMDYVIIVSLFTYVSIYVVILIFSVLGITKIYSQAIGSFDKQKTSGLSVTIPRTNEIQSLTEAIKVAKQFRDQSLGFCFINNVALIVILAFGLQNTYLFYNISQSIVLVGLIPVPLNYLQTV